ncbi:MAG TPA: hypothetical protein VF576_04415 [Rubricoccaceae bacterium]
MTDTAAASRPLQALWGALCAGGLAALVVLVALAVTQEDPTMADRADAAFYGCAVYGVVALALAFWLLHRMEGQLMAAPSDAAALAVVRTHGVAAMAAVESSAVLAGVAAFLTGNLLAVAFGVPLVAFTALTWPSADRVAGWLSLRDRR